MAATAPNTIVLRSNSRDNGMQRVMEAPCQAAVSIKPGMLLAFGTTNTVKPHATAGGNREGTKVALDNWAADGVPIDTTYAAAETVRYIHGSPGDVLYMLIETGSTIAKGAALESNGAGALQALAGTATDVIVGYAEEAVTNSSGSDARIRVRIA
jgi:hypothetical protein